MTEIYEPRNREQWRAGIREEWQRVKQRGTPIAEAMNKFDEVLLQAHPEWLLDDVRYQAAFGVYNEIRDIGREVYGDELPARSSGPGVRAAPGFTRQGTSEPGAGAQPRSAVPQVRKTGSSGP